MLKCTARKRGCEQQKYGPDENKRNEGLVLIEINLVQLRFLQSQKESLFYLVHSAVSSRKRGNWNYSGNSIDLTMFIICNAPEIKLQQNQINAP